MRFYTQDLLSRSGFEDGDLMCEFVEKRGERVCPKALLWEVIMRCVVPHIRQELLVSDGRMTMGGHNPAQAYSVDGIEVEGDDFDYQGLTPEFVDVPLKELERIHEELAYRRANHIIGDDEW